jgi:hypothetical protein
MNPAQVYPPCPFKIHSDILPPTSRSSSLSLSFMFSYVNFSCSPTHVTLPVHLVLLYVVTLMMTGEQHKSWSVSIRNLFRSLATSGHSGPNIFLNILSLCSSFDVRDNFSQPNYTAGRIIVLRILIFIFLSRKTKNTISNKLHCPNLVCS